LKPGAFQVSVKFDVVDPTGTTTGFGDAVIVVIVEEMHWPGAPAVQAVPVGHWQLLPHHGLGGSGATTSLAHVKFVHLFQPSGQSQTLPLQQGGGEDDSVSVSVSATARSVLVPAESWQLASPPQIKIPRSTHFRRCCMIT
jgi:hypothetical protein